MNRKSQHGSALATAIMLLVVLSLLAAFIVSVSSRQQAVSALDIMELQADQAARAGLQWGRYQAATNSSCAALNTLGDDLAGMVVSVECVSIAPDDTVELGMGTIYTITATACNIPQSGRCPGNPASRQYVERRYVSMFETGP